MKCAKCFSAALLGVGLLALPATASAAGFQLTGQSATATGMADTGVANPNEPDASYYNPASMGLNTGFKVYLGDTIVRPSTTFSPKGGGAEIDTKSQTFPPPNLHISYDDIAKSGLSFGAGVSFAYGLGISWPDHWVGRTNIKSQELQTANINPNLAYKIPGMNLSVAAGAQIIFGSVDLQQSVALSKDQFVEAHLGGSGMGFGGVAAVMYQPIDKLTLGVQYRSRVKLNFDQGKVHFSGEENTPFNTVFRDNPASTSMTLPDLIAAGVSYQLDKLYLAFDFNYTMWKTYDKIVLNIDTGGDKNAIDQLTIDNHWKNAMAFRLGAQYDVVDNVSARLGVAYDMTPIPDSTVNASLPGNDRISGSLGVGYTYNGMRTDIAYEMVQALKRTIDNGRAPTGDYSTTAQVLSVNVGYGF